MELNRENREKVVNVIKDIIEWKLEIEIVRVNISTELELREIIDSISELDMSKVWIDLKNSEKCDDEIIIALSQQLKKKVRL